EGILHVGVDVHLHDAVVERLVNLVPLRARAAVDHQVEARRLPEGADDGVLAVAEDGRLQLDVPRLVDAVYVAEGGGEQVTSAGRPVQAPRDFQGVVGRRV